MPLGGRVVVNGDDWHAVSDDGQDIEATATVMILRVESTTLIVRRAEQ
jgi:membrane-bound ClpP family serine protease